jgi:hypothetical protein
MVIIIIIIIIILKPDDYRPFWLSISLYPLLILFKITYILTLKFLLAIIIFFIIFSQLMTGLVYMVPPLSILLLPASMVLFEMPWNRQFPVAT